MSELTSESEKKASIQGTLKANRYTEYFWMPPIKQKGNALVADLGHMFSIGLEDLYSQVEAKKIQRTISLSKDAYFLLLVKLAWLYLRPASPETQRDQLEKWTL